MRFNIIIFLSIFFMGVFSILCFYAEHYIALNTHEGEMINFFGTKFNRTFIVDTLLALGIFFFLTSLALMLLYIKIKS